MPARTGPSPQPGETTRVTFRADVRRSIRSGWPYAAGSRNPHATRTRQEAQHAPTAGEAVPELIDISGLSITNRCLTPATNGAASRRHSHALSAWEVASSDHRSLAAPLTCAFSAVNEEPDSAVSIAQGSQGLAWSALQQLLACNVWSALQEYPK